jgi:CheY-like chemotaxis protein
MARVLIVEDEEQVRVLAQSYLREQGHYTLSAATPVEALAALGVADGIDHDQPHGGLDLAKEARQRRPDLKVLYVTSQSVTDGMKAMMVEGVYVRRRGCLDQAQYGHRPASTIKACCSSRAPSCHASGQTNSNRYYG